jgi:tRNA (cmo5U34)-methyltransferase
MSTGKVGENIVAENASWTFSGKVAETFSDHVRRSVPLYEEGHDLVCKISDFFLEQNSVCYELGVSTAALLRQLAARHPKKNVRFVGIDIEEAMIEQARKEIGDIPNVSLIVDDINQHEYEPADLIVSYYTVQFVPPKRRQQLIDRVYKSLNWGGAFLMFEKVRAADARFQDIATALYTDYKIDQGYNSEEILSKTRSLKGVLEPFSTQGNLDLLKRAGFVDIMSVMKYVCFEGFLAIK